MESPDTFNIIIRTCCGISIISIIFSLTVCLKFKNTLPVFYAFVAVIQSAASLKVIFLIIPDKGPICYLQTFFNTYSSLSAVFWSMILAQKFYARHVYEEEISKNLKLYTAGAFGLPLILASLPLATGNSKDIKGICWISGHNDLIWKVFCYYLFIIIGIVFTYWRYKQLINEIKLDMQDLPNSSVIIEDKKSSFFRMRLYSIILIICFGPSLIYLVFEAAGQSNETIELIFICFECLFGFMNALVYVCKQDIMELIAESLNCKKKGRDRDLSKFMVMDDEGRDMTAMQDFSVI